MKSKLATTFAGLMLLASSAYATTLSVNVGSLGAAANGINSDGVALNLPGALAAAGDLAVSYSGGSNTVVPYNPSLNPVSSSPFSIEFWAKPSSSDNDDAVLSNRKHDSPRSGWVFYQRAAGWNLRMYNGSGSTLGHDLTGGTSLIGLWSHVVGVWDGTTAKLFVNGLDTGAIDAGPGGYQSNITAINFSAGAHDFGGGGASPFEGLVDETAFYGAALTPTQIADHYSAASNPSPGLYQSMVLADGAMLHLNNVPEPSSFALLALSLAGVLRRNRK